MAWAYKALMINQFKSSRYDFQECLQESCWRYGDYILREYGFSTDEHQIWTSFAVLLAEYMLFFVIATLCLKYLRVEPTPPPPVRNANAAEREQMLATEDTALDGERFHLPYDAVSFVFKDINYTVTLQNREKILLLQGVDGFFEPGTMTALMGSSGAGKTTLLDVLAGRKNTGVVEGEIFLNGVPKSDKYFRKIMAYVEQFDSLPRSSTAREAITFSAVLRLATNTSEYFHQIS